MSRRSFAAARAVMLAATLACSCAYSPGLMAAPHGRRCASPEMGSPFKVRERISRTAAKVRLGFVEIQNSVVEVSGWYGSRTGRGDDEEGGAPAVLEEDICLVPGQPVVRVEAAPGNSRRIFTGIDIVAEGCENVTGVVWNVLTDYPNLATPVPNLVENRVVSRESGGARLEQVGAAKIAPYITFTATTTLDVREWPRGLPKELEADHLSPAAAATSRSARDYGKGLPLERGIFPRPYSLSSVANADITMQGVEGEGDFSFYQGVWRCQPLPGCAPPGSSAMRLTYSVELRPKAWVPVALLEGQIATTLGENLVSIRTFVEDADNWSRYSKPMPPSMTATT